MKARAATISLLIVLPASLPQAERAYATPQNQAVTRSDSVYQVSEILVEAERLVDLADINSRPGFIAIIPMDDVSRRVTSAGDHLAQSVGVHVRSTGGYGAYSTASVRGSSAKQVRVFLDGVPLHQARSGILDLAAIPASSLSRVEVYRGYGPFDLSGSSIGGVINLVTKNPGAGAGGHLLMSYGSHSTQRYGGSYSFSGADWNFLGLGEFLTTRGDFEFPDDNGTPYNLSDDAIARRLNNDLAEGEALVKATGPIGDGTLVITDQLYYRKQGLPGYSAMQSPTEGIARKYNLFHLAWHRKPPGGVHPRVELGAHYLYEIDHFRDDKPPTYGGKPDEKNRTASFGLTARWGLALPALRQSLRGKLAFTRESFRPQEVEESVVDGETQVRNTLVVSVEDEIYLYGDMIRLLPSFRFESYTDRLKPFSNVRADMAAYFRNLSETALTHPQTLGSVGLVISPGGGLIIKANYGSYSRVPSLMELFGYRGMAFPNPNLVPESGVNRDIGLAWSLSLGGISLSAECAYFQSNSENLIMYTYLQWARAAQAVNINSAEIDGYEISLAVRAFRGFTFSGNLTRLHAVSTGPITYTRGKSLPNRPGLEAHAEMTWCGRGISALYEFDYISGNYWNAYNGVAPNNKGPLFDLRRLHGAGITLPTGLPGTDLTLEVKNITDEHVEDMMGYPLPGRTVYGTITIGL